MICLGIESTAHTFGCGIVSDKGGKCSILANEKDSVTTEEGGLIPRELAKHHFEKAKEVIESGLKKANLKMKDIDLVAFSQGPGIGQALRVGAIAARTLALANEKPLLGVNHCVAHVEIGKAMTGAKDPIVVYVSGANTQIIGYEEGKYRVFGETLDIGLGNLLDSFGRKMGLGFPAGPALDKMYFEKKKYVELPYTVKGMDLAFSGLGTAAGQKIGKERKEDLAYGLLHNAFAMLAEVSERALAHTEKEELLLTGGVAASKALREMLEKMCNARNAKFFVPPFSVCVDQAAMIAWLGLVEFRAGNRMKVKESGIDPRQRTDAIRVNWLD
ncbi:MAG: bifunctional N(6)-L-threonylcarbamoyladenine synthase/serine/threonine protein kinase [Candidatus Diapherotrites archaeon]|uniref:tRNA N6-adenosine threonylcarbamoyltransferase n=1 Tax=Candidatus Iainarchaeum sp. TaxID=3101447 RepID=A0A938YT85_9ARCH|nr:bifunctional N(6)-L-threonylcarbamoyladenine synthase/serine/threonine protein kinase [Candidatus Diapherotrites archaeon]